jgi:hypothetical protein
MPISKRRGFSSDLLNGIGILRLRFCLGIWWVDESANPDDQPDDGTSPSDFSLAVHEFCFAFNSSSIRLRDAAERVGAVTVLNMNFTTKKTAPKTSNVSTI